MIQQHLHSQRSKQVCTLVLVAALCAMPVGARAMEETGSRCAQKYCYCDSRGCMGASDKATLDGMVAAAAAAKRVESVDCTDGWCALCFVGGDCTMGTPAEIASKGPYQFATTEPPPQVMWTPPPDTLHRTRCLPVGADHIVDCWVEGER